MAKNFQQPGDVLTVPAPTGGVASGDVVAVGALIGIAAFDAAEAEDLEVAITGVFTAPKATADDISIGDRLYWDSAAGEFTVATAGNTKAGLAAKAAGSGATEVDIRFTPGVG